MNDEQLKKLLENAAKLEQELNGEKDKNKKLEEQILSFRKEKDMQYNLREDIGYQFNNLQEFVGNNVKSLLKDILEQLNSNFTFFRDFRQMVQNIDSNFIELDDVISQKTENIRTDLEKLRKIMKQFYDEVLQKSDKLTAENQNLIERINLIISDHINSNKSDIIYQNVQIFGKEHLSKEEIAQFPNANSDGIVNSEDKVSKINNDQIIKDNIITNLKIKIQEQEANINQLKDENQNEAKEKCENKSSSGLNKTIEEIEINQEKNQNQMKVLKMEDNGFEVKYDLMSLYFIS